MPQLSNGFLELTNIISNIAVTFAVIFGIIGLWTWRSEHTGKTKFEVARKMVQLSLKFRDEFRRVRYVGTFLEESFERKQRADEMPNETKVLDEQFVRWRRLRPLQDTLRNLYEVGWEAEVILSEDDAKLVQLFEKLFQELYFAIELYFGSQLDQAKRQIEVDNEEMTKYRNIIYGYEGDEIFELVDSAADTVKKQLKKYIR